MKVLGALLSLLFGFFQPAGDTPLPPAPMRSQMQNIAVLKVANKIVFENDIIFTVKSDMAKYPTPQIYDGYRVVTQYDWAYNYDYERSQYSNATVLVAHGDQAGAYFYRYAGVGFTMRVYYEGNWWHEYRISEVRQYQWLRSTNQMFEGGDSLYVDLETNEALNWEQLTKLHWYTLGNRLSFYACLKEGDDGSWGRTFWTGELVAVGREFKTFVSYVRK